MSHFGPGSAQQPQRPYADTDMYNQQYNAHSDTELINLAQEAHPVRTKTRPFDWFICSVLGYICCACTGICAMYYAVRANHAVDWERDPENIRDHTKKAKCLTLTSIIIGSIIYLIIIIVTIVAISNILSTVYAVENAASHASASFNGGFNYNN